jgi:hypothetical protein
MMLITRPEPEDKLVGVAPDYRVEDHDIVRVRGIAQYVALAV